VIVRTIGSSEPVPLKSTATVLFAAGLIPRVMNSLLSAIDVPEIDPRAPIRSIVPSGTLLKGGVLPKVDVVNAVPRVRKARSVGEVPATVTFTVFPVPVEPKQKT
jgi:hypothetical protein